MNATGVCMPSLSINVLQGENALAKKDNLCMAIVNIPSPTQIVSREILRVGNIGVSSIDLVNSVNTTVARETSSTLSKFLI